MTYDQLIEEIESRHLPPNKEPLFHKPPEDTKVVNDLKPVRVEYFCNNCFKPSTELLEDGQLPICKRCLDKRNANRSSPVP